MSLIFVFVALYIVMSKHFSNQLKNEKKLLLRLFFIFLVCYVLRTFYMYFIGTYRTQVICNFGYRIMIDCILPLLWDILPIFSIMFWHHNNFKERKKPINIRNKPKK